MMLRRREGSRAAAVQIIGTFAHWCFPAECSGAGRSGEMRRNMFLLQNMHTSPRVRYCGWNWFFFINMTVCCYRVWGLGLSRVPTGLIPILPSAFDWSQMYTLAIRCSTSVRKTRHPPVKFSVWIPQALRAGLWFPCRRLGLALAEPSLTRHVNKRCCEPPCCLADRRLPLHKAANLLRGECNSNSKTFSLQALSSCFFPWQGSI